MQKDNLLLELSTMGTFSQKRETFFQRNLARHKHSKVSNDRGGMHTQQHGCTMLPPPNNWDRWFKVFQE